MLTDTETRMLLVREHQARLAQAAAAGPRAAGGRRWRRRPALRRPRLVTGLAKPAWHS